MCRGKPTAPTTTAIRTGAVAQVGTAHGVILGATGSGKTGLAIGMCEALSAKRVPLLIIDPKGDIGNLARLGPVYGDAQWDSQRRATGIPDTKVDALLRNRTLRVYTPGALEGVPLAMLPTLTPNTGSGRIATAILTLAGIDSPPLTGIEYALLVSLIDYARDATPDTPLTLASLVLGVAEPPDTLTIGALDLDTLYPLPRRLKLARALNALLTPGWAAWLRGDPIDVDMWLSTPGHCTVVSLAHLPEGDRMRVVTLLLGAVLDWTRRQKGRDTLRAVVYMDEIAGYLPPVAKPPSKAPLMALLTQGRAIGLGVLLATQNAGHVDYRALANIGSWWVGALRTKQERTKVAGALANGTGLDIAHAVASTPKREFIQAIGPTVTRVTPPHTLAHLAGPMLPSEVLALGIPPAITPPQPPQRPPQPNRQRQAYTEPPTTVTLAWVVYIALALVLFTLALLGFGVVALLAY